MECHPAQSSDDTFYVMSNISRQINVLMTAAAAAGGSERKQQQWKRKQEINISNCCSCCCYSDSWYRRVGKENIALLLFALCYWIPAAAVVASSATQVEEIKRGFSASPTSWTSSSSSFQPLLQDPSGNFSLAFLSVGTDQLDLAIVHVPSSFPLWRALGPPSRSARWSPSTTVSFDGRLVLSDPVSGIFWSAQTEQGIGDSLLLLNTSNLQIRNQTSLLWQSFDYPSDTVVQNQNFTSFTQLYSSANGHFFMRLGPNYLGLYLSSSVMYWKETALEARAEIIDGKGPIYVRINATAGFMGIYQQEGPPADVMPFDSFNRKTVGDVFRRLTLESDGNLRGYYWNTTYWVLDFTAISDTCDLPSYCGAYGLCRRDGTGGTCGCLDNDSTINQTTGGSGECVPEETGNLCSSNDSYWVLRRTGVDLAYKELLGSAKTSSLEECEGSCERNCSCWGAIYSNVTGSCYGMDFPIETLVEEGGQGKIGYFKVRRRTATGQRSHATPLRAGVTLLVVGFGLLMAIAGFGAYKLWQRRTTTGTRWRWSRNRAMTEGSTLEEGLPPVPYKDLKDNSSFRSIELPASSHLRITPN